MHTLKWCGLSLRTWVCSVACLLLCVSIASAQTTVSGTVVDQSGGAVAGATVTLVSPSGPAPQVTSTDANGAFTLQNVAAGRHTLRVEQRLFDTASVDLDVLSGVAPAPLRIALTVAAVREVVNVSGPEGYVAPKVVTSAKTDTPLLETPFAIQVVPRALMIDQMALRMKDAVRNISGVSQQGEPSYDGFQVRGFSTDGLTTIYRDGLRERRARTEMATLSDIEILKGPAGSLYGRIEPGGLVNLVTAKPADQPAYSVDLQAGSYNLWRGVLGATGPVNASKTLLYRIDVVAKKSDTFVSRAFGNRVGVYPSLAWRPSSRTEVNVNAEWQHDRSRYWVGIPAVGAAPAAVPVTTFLGFGDSANEYQTHDKTLVGANWSHRFGQTWKLTQRFHAYHLDYVFGNTWYGASMAADGRTLTRSLYTAPQDFTNTWATNLDLTGSLKTGALTHRVLIGADRFDENTRQALYSGAAPAAFNPTIDIYAPTYFSVPSVESIALTRFSKGHHFWNGVYAQDQVTLLPQLQVLVGGRLDYATRFTGTSATSIADAEARYVKLKNSSFSPRVGLVVRPSAHVSLYANYVESMGAPNAGTSASGATFDPETAQQYEGGVKLELFAARFLASAAVYNLKKQNVLQADPANPAFRIAIGETASDGVEFDLAGRLTERLQVTANYSHLDARIEKNSANVGKRLYAVPVNSGSLWARYEFAGGLDGLGLGIGLVSVGQRFGNLANTWSLEAYNRFDAAASYRFRRSGGPVTLQVNLENLTNERYFQAATGDIMAIPGSPRAAIVSMKTVF